MAASWRTDDDSSEDEEVLLLAWALETDARERRWWVHDTLRKREQLGEFHHLIRELEEDDERFFQYFRMRPQVFNELLDMIREEITVEETTFRKSIGAKERLAICLR